jgi:hypothetical protein
MRRVKITEHPVILVLPNGDEITAVAIEEGVLRLQQDCPEVKQHLIADYARPHGIKLWLR